LSDLMKEKSPASVTSNNHGCCFRRLFKSAIKMKVPHCRRS
jgi:hypothetical protein